MPGQPSDAKHQHSVDSGHIEEIRAQGDAARRRAQELRAERVAVRRRTEELRARQNARTLAHNAALQAEVASLRRELEWTSARLLALVGRPTPGDGSQADLAAIVRSTEDAIYSMKVDATILTWNDGAQHLLGYTADEVIGRSGRRLVPEDQLAAFEESLDRIRKGERALSYDAWRLHRDGPRVEVSVSLAQMLNVDGSMSGFSVILRDLSSRREADAALAAIEVRQRMYEDHERIARNLNDLVIGRIFATGLEVQAAAGLADAEVERRLARVVGELDVTITELRSTIFGLRSHSGDEDGTLGLRARGGPDLRGSRANVRGGRRLGRTHQSSSGPGL